MTRLLYTLLLLFIAQVASVAQQAIPRSENTSNAAGDTAEAHHRRGVEFHSRRSLNDASSEYARALALDPPRELTADEWKLVRRFAPRLYTTPTESFPLKDFAVIVHPTERLIAYHFFWEDDIDFPEDNDPCDHELIWVKYSADKSALESVMTYYHGRILEGGPMAINDARAHGMRPRINVQWGKHGSLLVGWEEMTVSVNPDETEKKYYPANNTITIQQDQQSTYRRLSEAGHRLLNHPISQRLGWPQKFKGSWEDFVNFSRLIDPLQSLDKTKMARVTLWNNGTINQYFLTYNFRPKTEWPTEKLKAAASAPRPVIQANALEDFQLPPKSVFDKTMPRYPNAWFYVDATLASSPETAVKLVTENLRAAMRLRESYGPFSNPEGCDFEAGLEHLQPWEIREQRPLQHSHAFHIRYYYSALTKQKLDQVKLKTDSGEKAFYRFGASAHYEVEHTNPNHADVESCPICGRMGEYRDLKGNLVELVHDPLGLELLQSGKVRGETVRFEDWEGREVGSIEALKDKFSIQQFTFPAQVGDKNTLRIGVITFAAR